MATAVTGSELELNRIKKQRTALRRSFTNLWLTILEKLNTEGQDFIEIQGNLMLLEKKNDQLQTMNELIMEKLLEADCHEDQLGDELTTCDEYSNKFYPLKAKLDSLTLKFNEKVINNSCNDSNCSKLSDSKAKIRLPKIEFVKFDGNLKNWLNFWSQFQKIHLDLDLSNEDKFQFLIQATEPKSRAREIVNSFPPIGDNYPKVIECLKSRFGREDLQTEIYVRELLKITFQNFSEKIPISSLYDKVETQLRALDTLGVTTDKCAALLYPLVESCLSEELLRAWQRSLGSTGDKPVDLKTKLESLVLFLKGEVESEERIKLAMDGFESCKSVSQNRGGSVKANLTQTASKSVRSPNVNSPNRNKDCRVPSASELVDVQSKSTQKCVFCEGSHSSENCFSARKLPYDEKVKILKEKGLCYLCLKPRHLAKHCKTKLQCIICGRRHVALMCKQGVKPDDSGHKTSEAQVENSLSANTRSEVLLQTLIVCVKSDKKVKNVRVLIDTGSQRSYITQSLAREMQYKPVRREKLQHSLFGGVSTKVKEHTCYRVRLSSLEKNYACSFEVFDKDKICNALPVAGIGDWMEELKELGVKISDTNAGPIDILIGADIAGKLLMDERVVLSSGLVAVKTLLGWTLLGKTPSTAVVSADSPNIMTTHTMLLKDKPISQLWELDVIGIEDPNSQKNKLEEELEATEFFNKNVQINGEGRYEVPLLWKEGHPPLPTNVNIAAKRLESTVKKLREKKTYDVYDAVFKEWEQEDIIEEVPYAPDFGKWGHYLPHRPVYKENSTTKVRPVFDASAKEYNQPSLNDCLSKGANLIELIPSILLRFRVNKIGVISDIKKAFLQISLSESDRDFLRFLWYNEEGTIKIYRHKRVVFGVSCSPFLLAATINYHLNFAMKGTEYPKAFVEQLMNSFYVDNCVMSVRAESELNDFISQATSLFSDAKFELRGWEFTDTLSPSTQPVAVLGMLWDKRVDVLKLNVDFLKSVDLQVVTKRKILSITHKVYDVIGISSPVTLLPKILLQKTWSMKFKWDEEVSDDIKCDFLKWFRELKYLHEISIPRFFAGEDGTYSLHIFCDASKHAYATVVFLRTETNGLVKLHFVTAKSRVAPVKNLSIPRLELLAATIGARIGRSIVDHLNIPGLEVNFWSDSTTVISWIQREDNWATFVWNRSQEIRSLTCKESWRYVPENLNPADLASRGCSAKDLVDCKWWEGPHWLRLSPEEWPKDNMVYNEEAIQKKKGKG